MSSQRVVWATFSSESLEEDSYLFLPVSGGSRRSLTFSHEASLCLSRIPWISPSVRLCVSPHLMKMPQWLD